MTRLSLFSLCLFILCACQSETGQRVPLEEIAAIQMERMIIIPGCGEAGKDQDVYRSLTNLSGIREVADSWRNENDEFIEEYCEEGVCFSSYTPKVFSDSEFYRNVIVSSDKLGVWGRATCFETEGGACRFWLALEGERFPFPSLNGAVRGGRQRFFEMTKCIYEGGW